MVVALAGCGSNAGEEPRVERCVERLLSGAKVNPTDEDRAYVRRTYCGPAESRGWVYEDGALAIEAQHWLEEGGSEECGTAAEDGESVTIPCVDESRTIDCVVLHHVRRSEVRAYVAQLRDDVECDDGTPFEQLGVP